MSKIIDSLVGHVIGDAIGTPVEFFMRKYLILAFKEVK